VDAVNAVNAVNAVAMHDEKHMLTTLNIGVSYFIRQTLSKNISRE
jgi:hypothetical protein